MSSWRRIPIFLTSVFKVEKSREYKSLRARWKWPCLCQLRKDALKRFWRKKVSSNIDVLNVTRTSYEAFPSVRKNIHSLAFNFLWMQIDFLLYTDVTRFCLFCISKQVPGGKKCIFTTTSIFFFYCPSTFCDALWLFIT